MRLTGTLLLVLFMMVGAAFVGSGCLIGRRPGYHVVQPIHHHRPGPPVRVHPGHHQPPPPSRIR